MSKLRPKPTETLVDEPLPFIDILFASMPPELERRIRAALDFCQNLSTDELEMLARIHRVNEYQQKQLNNEEK